MNSWVPIDDRPEDEQRDFRDAMAAGDVDSLRGFAEQGIGLDDIALHGDKAVRQLAADNGWEFADYAAGSNVQSQLPLMTERFDADWPAQQVTSDTETLERRFEALDVDGKVDMLSKLSGIYTVATGHADRAFESAKKAALSVDESSLSQQLKDNYVDARSRKDKLDKLGDFMVDKVTEMVDEMSL